MSHLRVVACFGMVDGHGDVLVAAAGVPPHMPFDTDHLGGVIGSGPARKLLTVCLCGSSELSVGGGV